MFYEFIRCTHYKAAKVILHLDDSVYPGNTVVQGCHKSVPIQQYMQKEKKWCMFPALVKNNDLRENILEIKATHYKLPNYNSIYRYYPQLIVNGI